MEYEDFCIFFKPLIDDRPILFSKAVSSLCEIGELQYKKIISKNKKKYVEIMKKYNIKGPNNDFIFRKVKVIKLKKKVEVGRHSLESLKSGSLLVLLLFKDILFKMNQKAAFAKLLCT